MSVRPEDAVKSAWWPELLELKDTLSYEDLARRYNTNVYTIRSAFKLANVTKALLPPGPKRPAVPQGALTVETIQAIGAQKDQVGKVPDQALAAIAGVTPAEVAAYRKLNKIPAFVEASAGGKPAGGRKAGASASAGAAKAAPASTEGVARGSKLDAYVGTIGTVPDAEIALAAGMSVEAVRLYRKKHGIASFFKQAEAAPADKPAAKAKPAAAKAEKPAAAKTKPAAAKADKPAAAKAKPAAAKADKPAAAKADKPAAAKADKPAAAKVEKPAAAKTSKPAAAKAAAAPKADVAVVVEAAPAAPAAVVEAAPARRGPGRPKGSRNAARTAAAPVAAPVAAAPVAAPVAAAPVAVPPAPVAASPAPVAAKAARAVVQRAFAITAVDGVESREFIVVGNSISDALQVAVAALKDRVGADWRVGSIREGIEALTLLA